MEKTPWRASPGSEFNHNPLFWTQISRGLRLKKVLFSSSVTHKSRGKPRYTRAGLVYATCLCGTKRFHRHRAKRPQGFHTGRRIKNIASGWKGSKEYRDSSVVYDAISAAGLAMVTAFF